MSRTPLHAFWSSPGTYCSAAYQAIHGWMARDHPSARAAVGTRNQQTSIPMKSPTFGQRQNRVPVECTMHVLGALPTELPASFPKPDWIRTSDIPLLKRFACRHYTIDSYSVEAAGYAPASCGCKPRALLIELNPRSGASGIRIRIPDLRSQCPACWTIVPFRSTNARIRTPMSGLGNHQLTIS